MKSEESESCSNKLSKSTFFNWLKGFPFFWNRDQILTLLTYPAEKIKKVYLFVRRSKYFVLVCYDRQNRDNSMWGTLMGQKQFKDFLESIDDEIVEDLPTLAWE